MVGSNNNTFMINLYRKTSFFTRNSIISLLIIGLIGLYLRIYHFPSNIPLTKDALGYFLYATDLSVLGHLPSNIPLANNGWPIFLSMFFVIFRFDNSIDYMTLQRLVTVSLSLLTIISVYFLCKRFFDRKYALLGAAIFSFEPHIIQNSVLGITEPLFILTITSAITLFFNTKRKFVYYSFAILAFASLVRAEGLFVFFGLLIIFFIRFRKEGAIIQKSALASAIFILLLLPMLLYRIETTGYDALTGRVILGGSQILTNSAHEGGSFYLLKSLESIIKLSGWSMIPFFIVLVPIGIFLTLRKRNFENMMIIVLIISMMFPVLYAFSVAPDTRYIYPLFPLFCIISIVTIKELVIKTKYQNLLLIVIIVGILSSSYAFLDIKKFDYEYQIEAFHIAQYIINSTKGINSYSEDSYVISSEIPKKWPSLSSEIPQKINIIPIQGSDSLENYLKSSKNKGLTDLIIDENHNQPKFLNDLFDEKIRYPYLTKIFDSWNLKYKYHVKIFRIDYETFQLTT